MPTSKHPWQNKSEHEREQVLKTVHACGRHRYTWGNTAALLGVSDGQLRAWKRDDPQGKIAMAYEAGSQETAAKIASRLQEKALSPNEDGNTPALILMAKHYLRMGDKQTNVNVGLDAPGEDSKPSDVERYNLGLEVLGLGSLAIKTKEESDDES